MLQFNVRCTVLVLGTRDASPKGVLKLFCFRVSVRKIHYRFLNSFATNKEFYMINTKGFNTAGLIHHHISLRINEATMTDSEMTYQHFQKQLFTSYFCVNLCNLC